MAEQVQIQKDSSDVAIGRRDDPAEARIDQRLHSEPGLVDLHGGALDRLPQPSDDGPAGASPQIGSVLSSQGQPLDSAVRNQMEGAFGEQFGDVRVHNDAAADRAAAAMNSTAFASGNNIGFAAGAYRPETGLGRGIIAHELGHVSEMQRGVDQAGEVRRFGEYSTRDTTPIFSSEWWNRAFGGGNFDDAELIRFMDAMSAPDYDWETRNYSDTDEMSNLIVQKVFRPEDGQDPPPGIVSRFASLRVRTNMLHHLLTGNVRGEDKSSAMTILREAEDLEFQTIVERYGRDALINDLGRRYETEINDRLGVGASTHQAEDLNSRGMPVRWRFNYRIDGAGQNAQAIRGLAVQNFEVSPTSQDSQDNPWMTVRPRALFESADGIGGTALPPGGFPSTHPRNMTGRGRMRVSVVPRDPSLIDTWAVRTERMTQAPGESDQEEERTGSPYGNLHGAPNQIVEGNLVVRLGTYQSGQVGESTTVSQSDSVSVGEGGRSSRTDTTGQSNTFTTSAESRVTNQVSEELLSRSGISAGHRQSIERMRNWHLSVAQTHEQLREMQLRGEFETTEGSEQEIDLRGTIGAELTAALTASLGLEAGAELSLDNPLVRRVLPSILSRLGAPGRVLGGILRIVDGVDANLSLGLEPSGSVRIHGEGTAGARAMWHQARRQQFSLGRRTAETDTTSAEAGTGGGITVTDEGIVTVTSEQERSVGQSTTSEVAQTDTASSTASSELQLMQEQTTSLEIQSAIQQSRTESRTSNLFLPRVERATLAFRVINNEFGEGPRPAPATPSEQEEEAAP
jgi:uncharacterized protein DUF4157